MVVGLIDYKAGNLGSVENALARLGAATRIVDRPERLAGLDRAIFPGVGEARAAMEALRERGLDRALAALSRSATPLLGICIGCQVLLGRSEERDTECLGIIAGTSRRFPPAPGLKIPQIGWNQVYHRGRHALFRGIPDGASFYFDHSYYPEPASAEAWVAETDYGVRFASALARGSVVAVQFHPEKSGRWGLALLANFLAWRAEAS